MNPTIVQTLARTEAAGKATIADLIEMENHGINVVKELGMSTGSVMRQAGRQGRHYAPKVHGGSQQGNQLKGGDNGEHA